MVSIPDWSKFSRIHDTLKEPGNILMNKYYKQREEETIRLAEEHGYFLVPTQGYLIKHMGPLNGRRVKDTNKIYLVKLVGVHMRKIGDISYCINLRICILHNNFLTKIDGLATCRQLIKLDLHSNQLTSVPGIAFWSSLRHLKFLLLHDNPLGKYETLQNIATCPNLMGLTLYDTPLGLKRNYRHHVVNSIWSLKALDHYVISDEEIIEDAIFGGRFCTQNEEFKINLCPPWYEDGTFEEEMALLRRTEAEINKIMAHHSPVLIIQRHIRGILTRKRFGSFGQKSKGYRSVEMPHTSDAVPPPPSTSPAFTLCNQDLSVGTSAEFDTYNKNRRPDSSAPSDVTEVHTSSKVNEPYPTPQPQTPQTQDEIESPKKKKNLLINLAKLQSGTFSTLYDEAIAIETILPELTFESVSTPAETKRYRRRKKSEQQKRIVKSVKQFFGPVVESADQQEPEKEIDDDTPLTQYRLRGVRPETGYIDAKTQLILSNQEAGRMVRDAEDEIHIRTNNMPRPKISPRKNINTDQRIFARVHGTMGISSLLAVHQAYRDREKAERSAARIENILKLHDEKDRAKERIRLFNEEKRNQALRKRDQERANMLEALERREIRRLSYLDKRHDIKARSSEMSRTFKADFTFITEFSTQHTSVSNALMRHDKQTKQEDRVAAKSDLVSNLKTTKQDQSEIVKKYLEHRQLMRQTESSLAKNELDSRMLQEANERIMEAKTRVAQQKQRKEAVKTFYPLPQTVTPAPNIDSTDRLSAPPRYTPGATHYEANALLAEGRIGKHHTMIL
ncbi:Leucine-rich repeat and IQ domain-containing protein 3 [Mytilus coruscus]|uniref:Leucine-rich repeat and IQ domain-containing protein 3 n=1 Tax=Mytilus coruscus TaxID=42192 RepID=A0A6J8AVT8_MYTCO|nr:Leucine-rich repeat and IQ domain-containing protein 3 [Mytilus coruscus]